MCPRCLFFLALDTPDEVSLVGEAVSHYTIIEKVGGGGMGVVFKAEDTRLGRCVALKVLPAEFCLSTEALSRFHREARIASSLNHPFICAVYDVGEHQGRPFIVMELLEGQALKHVISNGPLRSEQVIQMAAQIADGLAAAHGRGIIHRDIKPANLFVTARGDIKILDFGLAREEAISTELRPSSELTSRGIVLGTIPYMSPEQVEGKPLDHRTDLFSLGTVLYELATGKCPFVRDSAVGTMNAILHDCSAPARKLNSNLPVGLSNVIEKLLQKDPDRRYQTASNLLLDLEELGHGGRPFSWRRLRREWKKSWLVLASSILLALILGFAFVFSDWWRGSSQIGSVAVLPFENLSGDADLEYVADGMTEALNISLARLGELRVPSRTSVMQFKGEGKPISNIARQLRVDAVVEGSVRASGEKLFVRFSLVDAETDEILRSGDYGVDRNDFVEIQNEIARAIAEEIQGELSHETREKMRRLHPSDPAAYESFMRGLYLLNERASLDRAVEYFRQAAAKEPRNGLVHAYLAHAYLLSSSTGYGSSSPLEVVPKARWAAQKAIEEDNTLPQAHVAFATVSFSFDRDWDLAANHFQKAIEADPEYATGHHWYGLMLAARGDLDGALEKIQKAKELDPYSPVVSTAMGRIYYYRRDYEQAERFYREALELERDFVPGLLGLGLLHVARGEYQQAVAVFQKALPPESQKLLATFAMALRSPTGAEMVRRLSCKPGSEAHCCFYLAVAACVSGRLDETFYRLDQAYQAKSEYMAFLKVDPVFDPIRKDTRYQKLLERLGLH